MLFLTAIGIALLATVSNAYTSSYTIQSGDTYCQIAKSLGCPNWQTLANVNTQPVLGLQPGTNLNVPSSCSGSSYCTTGDYNTLAARFNVDVNCLTNFNCNVTSPATVCIPNNCPAYSAPAPPAPVQNGWYGTTFYCNGTATTNLNQNCGGLMYINGMLANGIVGSSFVCNGVYVSSPPPKGLYNCGGIMYNYGVQANGYVGTQFYCNGVPTSQTTGVCGGLLYINGMLYSGNYNGQFYCNGAPSSTGTGVCGGYYYQNFQQMHTCTQANNPVTQTCAQYLATNSATTQQNLIDCNPNLWLTPTNCGLPAGTILV